jgi:hypothetical protein
MNAIIHFHKVAKKRQQHCRVSARVRIAFGAFLLSPSPVASDQMLTIHATQSL